MTLLDDADHALTFVLILAGIGAAAATIGFVAGAILLLRWLLG